MIAAGAQFYFGRIAIRFLRIDMKIAPQSNRPLIRIARGLLFYTRSSIFA